MTLPLNQKYENGCLVFFFASLPSSEIEEFYLYLVYLIFKKKTAKKPGNKYICFILLYLSLLSLFYSVFFLVYCPVYRVIPTKDETVKTTKTFLYTTIISKKQILCLALNMALNSLFIDLAYKERSL